MAESWKAQLAGFPTKGDEGPSIPFRFSKTGNTEHYLNILL